MNWCFQFGMPDTAKLYSLIPLLMTLTFTRCHRFTGKLELLQLFCCKKALSNPNRAVVEYVMQITANKSCKYGKYRLFEHLLSLFSFILKERKKRRKAWFEITCCIHISCIYATENFNRGPHRHVSRLLLFLECFFSLLKNCYGLHVI